MFCECLTVGIICYLFNMLEVLQVFSKFDFSGNCNINGSWNSIAVILVYMHSLNSVVRLYGAHIVIMSDCLEIFWWCQYFDEDPITHVAISEKRDTATVLYTQPDCYPQVGSGQVACVTD